MQAVKVKENLPTGVTVDAINKFVEACGADYIHYANEQYPDKSGMRERIIAINKDAKVFYSKNVQLGRFFGFSQKEADFYFKKIEERLL